MGGGVKGRCGGPKLDPAGEWSKRGEGKRSEEGGEERRNDREEKGNKGREGKRRGGSVLWREERIGKRR